VSHWEHMQAARVEWSLRVHGPYYDVQPGGVRGDRIRWFAGPDSRRKAARDRRLIAEARPQYTLDRGEVAASRMLRVPAPRRQAPAGEQLSLLGGEA
jgi:hypothetical protein